MTQGMVTILKNGKVVMKIVVGCEGDGTKMFAAGIRAGWPMTVEQVAEFADDIGYGCSDCLVVIVENKIWYKDRFSHSDNDGWKDNVFRRYTDTFDEQDFNPRWNRGDCGYLELVEIG